MKTPPAKSGSIFPGLHLDRAHCDLVVELLKRDFKIRYSRSFFGFAWTIIKPLSQIFIFIFIFDTVLELNIPNYPSFVFIGVLFWTWFSTSLQSATMTIVENDSLIRRPGMPSAALPLVIVLSNAIHLILALPILFAVLVWQVGAIGWTSLIIFPAMIGQGFLTLALAYITAGLTVHFRDMEHIVGTLVMLGFYMTPVFYRPIADTQQFAFVHELNPMAWYLDIYRTVLIDNALPAPGLFFQAIGFSAVMLLIGFILFRRFSRTFMDYL